MIEALQSALTITAIKTPYLENGRIDLDSYDKLIEQQVLGGVEGVIVGGTTGEGQVCDYTASSIQMESFTRSENAAFKLRTARKGPLQIGELRDDCWLGWWCS